MPVCWIAAALTKNDSIKRAVYDIIVEVSAVLPLATLDLLYVAWHYERALWGRLRQREA